MALHIWRNFRVDLPEDWELLQFSRNPGEGRCAFADRHDFRFELSWRRVPSVPDFDRMMSDYAARLKEEGASEVNRVCAGEWQGLEARRNGTATSRYGRHFPEESCLVEAVLPWPGARMEPDLAAGILAGIGPEPVHATGRRRWRTFGMDFLVADGLLLDRCVFEAGKAEMSFTDARRNTEERVVRLGMLRNWLKGGVSDWLNSQLAEGDRVAARETMRSGNHSIECVRITHRRAGRTLLRRYVTHAAAWICPATERLYCITARGPAADDGARNVAGRLSCCTARELG